MSGTRRTPRALTRILAAATIIVGMSLALGTTPSSASEQDADAAPAYVCHFPSGDQRVPVKITGVFPAAETAGHAIRARDVTVTPSIPQAALADLTKLGASSVTASADLSVTVAQHGRSTKTAWPGLNAPSVPIPGSGALTLPATGAVPPATAESPGAVAFIAGPLRLTLSPRKADGGAMPPVPLDCTVELGSNVVLATVPVDPPEGSGPPPSRTGRAKAGARAARPADDDPCLYVVELPPVPGEAYMAGFSNVNKLNGATLLGREDGQTTGHVDLELNYKLVVDLCSPRSDTYLYSRAYLDDDGRAGLPPAKATFLTFGFMPTTGTLDLNSAEGTHLEIESHGWSSEDGTQYFEVTTVTGQMTIRIHDVLVNGTPLDVGPHCGTATAMPVTLTGNLPDYEVNTGGPLTGTVTIPPFSGCGVGENLDPLFTGSISGPDNYMKLTQGVPCTRPPDSDPQNCDPIDRPIPRP